MSRLILVLGPHRSGTSFITKALECLGVSLGDRAEWYSRDNETGFWEDQEILAINELVLQRYGCTWDSPTVDLTKPTIISDVAAVALNRLNDKLRRFPLFGLKEPRMCRLLPFWKPIIAKAKCEVEIVKVERSDWACADSLVARNGMTRERALALTLDHRHCIERDLSEYTDNSPTYQAVSHRYIWPVTRVSYELMVHDPELEIRFISKDLGLEVDEAKLDWFCKEFVRRA